jgi:hypothetical protein
MEFIDYPDMLLAIAVNNTKPWERYDQAEIQEGHGPLLPRWVKATTEPAVSADFEAELLRIHQIFQEVPDDAFKRDPIAASFRVLPIDDAGGDIGRDPRNESFQPTPGFVRTQAQAQAVAAFQQAVRANPGFYDVVTDDQLKVLQSNRFLQLEFHKVSDVMALLGRPIVDPSGTQVPQTANLIRYKYPNAKRWHEFTDILSQGLQQQLAQAEAQHLLEYNPFNLTAPFNAVNPSQGGVSPQFQHLNQLVLHELLRSRFDANDSGLNFFKNYQRFIAVHPFQDYNGRSLRALYRRMAGRPMFILNFNHDLYTDQATFEKDLRFGDTGFDFIAAGMAREQNAHLMRAQTDPRDMAKFFDLPEWWIVAAGAQDAGTLSRLVAFQAPLAPGQASFATRLVMESKRWISEVPIEQRIDKKLFDGVFLDFEADLRQANLLPQNPLAPLQRLPNPHAPAAEIRPARTM